MAEFGLPYQGSKDKIIPSLAMFFPKADHFYDLFGGGGSVTHYMMQHKTNNYKQFHYNEIRPGVAKLFEDAIAGKYNYEVFKPKWISKKDFDSADKEDAYIKLIWSFSNNYKTYLFNPDTEMKKKSLHNAIVFDDFDGFAIKIFGFSSWHQKYNTITKRRLFLRKRCRILFKNGDAFNLQPLQQLQRLQQLERLQQPLTITSKDYRDVEILPNSVIFCDIPYINTAGYGENKNEAGFDHKAFYDWAANVPFPVYISEYQLDDSRFKQIYTIKKIALMHAKEKRDVKEEKLFWNGKTL